MKTPLLIAFLLLPSAAIAGCDDPKTGEQPTFRTFVYRCTDDVSTEDAMRVVHRHALTAKRDGFTHGEGNILPDGEGGKVYSYKWSLPVR